LIKNNNRIDAIKAEMEKIKKEGAEQEGAWPPHSTHNFVCIMQKNTVIQTIYASFMIIVIVVFLL